MKKLLLALSFMAAGLAQADIDAATKAIYDRSCTFCHTNGGMPNIPKSGDAAAWEPRMAQGVEAMVASVKKGKGAMPPKGMCMDCTDEQFAALITYMATGK